jgi:hypothetical protein
VAENPIIRSLFALTKEAFTELKTLVTNFFFFPIL